MRVTARWSRSVTILALASLGELVVIGWRATHTRAEAVSFPAPSADGARVVPPTRTTPAAPDASIDVTYYDLDLALHPAERSLSGSVRVVARATRHIDALVLQLAPEMHVDSARMSGRRTHPSHVGSALRIPFPTHVPPGAPLDARIFYHGTPGGDMGPDNAFQFGSHAGAPIIASYGLPYSARQWWPAHDTPADKADSATLSFTVPAPMVAVSNGRLTSTRHNADTTITYRWHVGAPIYSDVISVVATNFVHFDSAYVTAAGDTMPIVFYVFPEDEAKARATFAPVPDILRTYVSLFGAYPYVHEKYGLAEFQIRGYREHQTITSLGAAWITGDRSSDRTLAHEVAHQWFGDRVTVRNWSHIWLNEGFATYAWALWRERTGGPTAYAAAMRALDTHDFTGTVFVADSMDMARMFTHTTFNKGAWVLHMLRHVMGDSAFFNTLRAWVRDHADGPVTTDDFRRACEAAHGAPLGWFFDEWVYRGGRPTYAVSWRAPRIAAGADSDVVITITQTQSGPVFRMPLDVRVSFSSGDTTLVVHDTARAQTVRLHTPGAPSAVRVDPNGWVLKTMAAPVAPAPRSGRAARS
ncbi:MAG TPA: M1 family metallopeptidase [Gemmatimonadaceae bacterium]|nr:M1 family metallopeptidase [Gemmatimonadaceae bacterium]